MLSRPEPACLVIADISGYTSYLAGVELDHAQDILADLIGTVVGALRPTFKLAKLEGDAAFAYAITEAVDGSVLQDLVEGCYFAFQRRLRDIRQASTCDCNACLRMPDLDLKFVVHHGSIGRQRMAGHEELVGSDVIVVHRLLKNGVAEALGLTAYAMYTEACARAMGIADPASAGLLEHRESYAYVGEVVGWVRDLAAAWIAEKDRVRVRVEPKDAIWEYGGTLPCPAEIAWGYLTSPAQRIRWQAGVTAVEEATAGGRRGVGTTNHCIHGKDAMIEEILDWRPPDYLTLRLQMPQPGIPKLTITESIENADAAGSSRLVYRVLRPRSSRDREILAGLGPMLDGSLRAGHQAMAALIAAEVGTPDDQAAGRAAEPELPTGGGRHLEPVR